MTVPPGKAAVALRYALAPACIGVAALLHVSPVGPLFHPMGLFIIGVIAAAWFGGAGPGVFAAFLSAISLPHLIAVTYPLSLSYPLFAGFFDLPRFITLGFTGAAVGWGRTSYQRARSTLRERGRSEGVLRESEERYERVVQASGSGFWDWDVLQDKYYVSPRFLEMNGFAPGTVFAGREDFVRRNPQFLEDGPKYAQYEQAVRDLFAGTGSRLSMEVRVLIGGEVRWRRLEGICFRDATGKVVRWTGSTTDITDRKRAELALGASEGRYALAMEAAGDGHTDWDLQTGEHYISPRLLEICGYAAGTTFRDRAEWVRRFPFHPEDRPKWQQAVAAHFAGRESHFKMELRIVVRDEVRWTAFHFLSTRDAAGTPIRWTGSISDITEQKQAEVALRESEERYQLAMAASESGYWDWHIPTGVYFSSAKASEMVGLPAENTYTNRNDFRARIPVHPEDWARWDAAREELFAGTGERLAMEVRYTVDGETRWHSFQAICKRDEAGNVVRWTGSTTNVTERKRAEEAQRLSEERYAYAMEAAQDAHWDWIIGTDDYYTSPKVVDVFGLPPGTTYTSRKQYLADTNIVKEDLEAWMGAARELFAGTGSRLSMELRAIIRGEVHWIQHNGVCLRDASGKAVRWCGSVRDVTERRREQEALRLSEERNAVALEVAEEGSWDWNVQTDEFFASPQTRTIYGVPRDLEYRTRTEGLAYVRMHPEDEPRVSAAWRAALAGQGVKHEFEYRILHDEGLRWIRTRWKVFRDDAGAAQRVIGIVVDITTRKLAEEALRRSEEAYALAMEAAQDAHWDWNMVTGDYYVSPRTMQLHGFPEGTKITNREQHIAMQPYLPEENAAWVRATAELFAGTGDRLSMEQRALVRGEIRWFLRTGVCKRDAAGKAIRWSGSVRDVTDRKRSEEALRLSEARYALAMEVAEEGHLDWNVQTGEFFASAQAIRVLDLPPDLEYRTRDDVWGRVSYHPEDRERVAAEWRAALAGPGVDHEMQYRILRGEAGETRWLRARWKVFRGADGRAQRVIGVLSDITDRKHALETLRESEARFRTLVELNSSGFWEQDEDFRYVPCGFAVDITGYATDERVGKTRWELGGDPTPLSGSWAEHQADLVARRPFREFEYRRVRPDGQIGYYSASGVPITDDRGRFKGYYGVASDITPRKRIEEELGRAQRLEAMGTLAGGIAHDFNNILGAILGYGEMAMRNAKKGTRLRRDMDSILAAGERGRSLVDRILAFSRSGVGERVPVHVQAVVREALDQVAASLPANVTIAPRLRAGRAAMLGDSTQVHQVVMNLASNAVHAMPLGGVLRVGLETVRVDGARPATVGAIAPGDYIVLKVSDTGDGIRDGVLERMFDPFYTTREVGVGSGLGLSLVHGIVTSVGGAIDVVTELGKGTTFTVYLRRGGDAPEKPADENRPLPRGEGQRVLVVDDEEPLVRLATETLERLGYAPVGFTSSTAALAAFRADPARFDALLTDERMPGLSGSALIREVRGIRDGLPVVLMSGYVGMESVDADVVVRKPLSARDLAASMARALEP